MAVKDGIRYAGLLVVGLGVATLLYPAMHEWGHVVAAWLLDVPVMDVHLLVEPRVQCDFRDVVSVAPVYIGWGGVVLPLVVSALLRPRSFWVWYAVFVWRCIAVFACVWMGVSVLLFVYGTPPADDDMTLLLQMFPHHWWGHLLLSVVLSTVGSVFLVREHPFRRCAAYFASTE